MSIGVSRWVSGGEGGLDGEDTDEAGMRCGPRLAFSRISRN